MAPSRDLMFYLYWEKHEKVFLSETIRPRVLIFSSNYALGPKMVVPRCHKSSIGLYRENIEKIFLSEAARHKALIYAM